MDIEQQIEDQAKVEAKRQIRQAKIEAIDAQLAGLRKQYAMDYIARGQRAYLQRLGVSGNVLYQPSWSTVKGRAVTIPCYNIC